MLNHMFELDPLLTICLSAVPGMIIGAISWIIIRKRRSTKRHTLNNFYYKREDFVGSPYNARVRR